jgi:hypothetical protein
MVIEVLEARKLMSVSAYPTAEFDAVRNGGAVGVAGTSADRCDPYADVRNYDATGRVPDQSGGDAYSTLFTDSGDGDISSTSRW